MCEIQDVRELLTELWSIVNKMVGDIDELHESDSEIESAKDMLWRARTITDEQLMVLTVSDGISKATSAKWALIKVYETNSNKSTDSIKGKEIVSRVKATMRAWALLTECVRIEFDGYEMLGEEEACYECLSKYASFLFHNKLYERDVVFRLFSNLPVKESEPLLNEDLIRVACEYCNCFA